MKQDGQLQNGYAMAALLVAMGVMAVLMTVVMPVWRQMAQREKEEELVFRGRQYARAIGLFERKYANTPPPTLDVLVQEKFLRKKYKDPITGADFVPIPAGQTQSAAPGTTPAQRGAAQTPQQVAAGFQGPAAAARGGAPTAGGVIGVTSASNARSIRIYNGASRYSDWRFIYAPPTATPGAGAPGAVAPGGRGGVPGGPGRPGGPGGPRQGGPGGQGNQPPQPGGPAGQGGPGRPNNQPLQPGPFPTGPNQGPGRR